MTIEAILKELESECRDIVFLRLYRLPSVLNRRAEDYIVEAFGPNTKLHSIVELRGADLLAETRVILEHAGQFSGYHPNKNLGFKDSQRFKELLNGVMGHLERLVSEATQINQFSLKKGHPAYPVYWDFAFVIVRPTEVNLIVGSASD